MKTNNNRSATRGRGANRPTPRPTDRQACHRTNRAADRPSKRRSSARLIAALAGVPALLFSCATMEGRAEQYVAELPDPRIPNAVITEDDIADLPPVVQRYMRYSGVIGKPRIDSFGFTMEGRIRNGSDANWMEMESRQFNLLSDPARIYYVRGVGNPMSGVDSFIAGTGRMQIKLFNLVTIDDVTGPEMDRSALVTFLNDLTFCPLGYFSLPVEWRQLSDTQAELSLTHAGMTVTAVLSFANDGRLLDWETADRYAAVDGRQLQDRWSTPMDEHGEVAGLRIPIRGRGVHNYDGIPFTYVELHQIGNLVWNIDELP